MKRLFKPKIFKTILAILVLFLIVKILWFIVEVLWLPTKGVSQPAQKDVKALYYRVKVTPNQVAAPVENVIPPPVQQEGNIKEIRLLALYSTSDATVVTVEHKSKTKILSRGDDINGFMLVGGGGTYAIFRKDTKTYNVMLNKEKTPKAQVGAIGGDENSTMLSPQDSNPEKQKPKDSLGDITEAGNRKIVDRSLIEHYSKNTGEVYKNIGIAEMKDGENLKGFWITFVKKDSHFAKLGLRRDDVIKSINGQEINSYNTAFGMYKNMQKMNNVTLVIQRGKEDMELEYEIN